ncbi:MAG TPA: class A beta-lactamase [Polyangiaceae bacterium]|nr:class A beta-lactamase [Polyangiaceae bacterium]
MARGNVCAVADERERAGLLSRRLVLCAGALPLGVAACASRPAPAPVAPVKAAPAGVSVSNSTAKLARLERAIGGRLGVAVLDTATGQRLEYRGAERFAMCSTFKLVLVGAVLARVDAGAEQLERRVAYDESALLEYAPVSSAHVAEGALSVLALCEAAVTVSDNTAANLLLATLGGPAGLTRYFRTLGDTVSRLDRTEPLLNSALPGDDRDTTTPQAMLGCAAQLLLGEALSAASRARLIAWLSAAQTGLTRLRAGLPPSFRAGDKTGTGEHGATSDIAIAWPPGTAPLLITAYAMGSGAPTEQLVAALAEVARITVAELGLS